MAENKTETKIVMLTIKEAAALVEGLTEYRVRQMCINDQVPHIMAGKKYLINKELFLRYLRGETGAFLIDISADLWYNVGGGNAP